MRNQKSLPSLLEKIKLNSSDRNSIEICGFIYGPQNILPLLSAIQELYSSFSELNIEIFYIFEDTKSILENQSSIQTVRQLIDFTESRLTAISKSDFDDFSSTYITNGSSNSKEYSQKMLFFPHSYDQASSELFEKLGEERVNICYGDGFGLAVKSDFQRNLTYKENLLEIGLLRKVYRYIRNVINLSKISELVPDFYVLIIGISQDGRILKSSNLIVCQKSKVLTLISKIQKSYGVESISSLKKISCLLLLDRFYESGLMSYEAELNLYIAILSKLSPIDGPIMVKNHPLANSQIMNDLKTQLPDIDFIDTPENISNLPIELWKLKDCKFKVISFGHPVYSLKYLYNSDTRKYFEYSYSLLPKKLQKKPFLGDLFSLFDSTLNILELDSGQPVVIHRKISFLDELTVRLVFWTRILRGLKWR